MDSLGHRNFEGWVKYLVIIRSGKWLLEELRLENFNAFPFHAVLSRLCTLSAVRISVRLLGSPLAAQEASVGTRGCRPGNWRLPPLRRCGLGTPLGVPAAPCPLALFQERQPGLRFLFLSNPCPLWTSSHGWCLFLLSLPTPESSLTRPWCCVLPFTVGLCRHSDPSGSPRCQSGNCLEF